MSNTIIFDDITPKVSEKLESLKPNNYTQKFQENNDESIEEKKLDTFTIALILFCAFMAGYFALTFSAIFGLIVGMFLFVIGVVAKIRRDKIKGYRLLAKSTTPFFISSKFRGDTTVCERAEDLKEDLNKSWVSDPFRPKPPVYELIWEYGGQTDEEFLAYSRDYQIRKTKEYHEVIKKANPKYYKAIILNQDGWKKEYLLGRLPLKKLTDAQLFELCFDFNTEWDEDDTCMIEWSKRGLDKIDFK